jgi:hypothetical protein
MPTLAARIVIESGPTVVDHGGDRSGELSNPAMRPPAASARPRPPMPVPEEHIRRVGRSRTLPDGRPMNYRQLITRAIDALDKNSGEARRALYERARNALVAQLRSNQPVLVLADITKERLALEEAIRKVEAEAARNSRTEIRVLRSVAPGDP